MDVGKKVASLITPTIEDMGFELVRVQLSESKRPKLQVMVERKDREGMNVDHCADISRAVSAILDVEDPVKDAYSLEVSSPGIDRPLVTLEHFQRFIGFEAKVEMIHPVENRKRFQGPILSVVDGVIQILVDGSAWDLSFGDIQRAKLVLTDDLMAAAMKEQGNDGEGS